MKRHFSIQSIFVTVLLLLAQPAYAVEKVLVYAAASTSQVINEIIQQFNSTQPDIKIKASFASSSTLAKQIEAGAPAHLYISANPTWMDYLQERQLIVNQSRQNLLSNRIVLITPADKPLSVTMNPGFEFAATLQGRLCLGEPLHVPAGIYAKQALVSLGWWQETKPLVVGMKDVRAALVMVELGECAAGIVYATDANASNKIYLAADFPPDSHEPIVYPVATLKSAPKSATIFQHYLSSPVAQSLFKKYGFSTQ